MVERAYLEEICRTVRQDIIRSVYCAKSGHPGGSLSAVEVLVALYFSKMRIDPQEPDKEDRDRFILSKGHAAPALYAVLAGRGYFERSELKMLRNINSFLQGAPGIYIPGIDMSSGSLGQGISVGVGMAVAGKMKSQDYKTYVMLGDGELQEGLVWEAFMAAAHYRLGNLVAIIDNNHVQMCGNTEEILSVSDIASKCRSFGWNVICVDGHNLDEILEALNSIDDNPEGQPVVLLANTVKGKGVSFMEGKAQWHGGAPSEEQYRQAMLELGGEVL